MPTFEKPVGLGKLEEANIQSSLTLKKSKAQVRVNVELRIDLTNVGKGPAKLVKMKEVAPRGFKVSKARDSCSVEESCINMRNRTLPPQIVENISLALRAVERGPL